MYSSLLIYYISNFFAHVYKIYTKLSQCVEQHIAGANITPQATMLKLKCGRLVREVVDSCLQFWGGL